uniref:Discoidin, CUB and LCCL domain containing 1 n=1 Tax=Lepisosteus oculatus TaxID=7918 RepID=W5NKM9_LEPOC
GDGCGYSVLGPESGVLTSRNYPGTYPNHTWCEWKIQVPEGKSIILKFGDLDIEAQQCDSDFVKIFKGSQGIYGTYCGSLDGVTREVHVDSSKIAVQFQSRSHISGRGFLLSYAASDRKDLLTCLDKGSHFSASKYRKYCPAGCKGIAGDVSGDVSQGYRHTSVLCKAAVHAGVILDELGGQISVEEHKGLSHYDGIRANGIQSKVGSLSDTRFMFVAKDCKTQTHLRPESVTASSSWQGSSETKKPSDWSPHNISFDEKGRFWAADHNNSRQWLVIDLGEKKKITGIITAGSTVSDLDFYVQSYTVEHKEKNKWKTYTRNSSSEDMVFEGNLDYWYQSRNNFLPPIVARFIRIVPQTWHQRIAMKIQLLGCQYIRANNSTELKPDHVKPNSKSVGEDEITEPVASQPDLVLVKLAVIIVPTLAILVLLVVGIYVCKMVQKKKTTENTYGSSDAQKSGCWKQIKQPFARHQSTEFTFSYSSEKDPMQKLDLVTSSMADYHQPLMIGTGTVTRKGSTFKPIDTDAKEELQEAGTHYDYLHTANPYALPLTNQEPEYATPIIERHNLRKEGFTQEVGYNVPALNKNHSFKTNDCSTYRKEDSLAGDYQTPQIRAERLQNGKGLYDKPKQNVAGTDYQRPQVTSSMTENYSIPRDCLKLARALPP